MTPQDMADTHAAAFTQSRPWSADEFASLLANRFTYTIGDKRSFALFQVVAEDAELLTIATHPGYQRQGLARRVMTDWHSKAGHLGAIRAFLDVASDNLPAIALYHSCGYTTCGRRKAYYQREYGSSVDAIVLECHLNGKISLF